MRLAEAFGIFPSDLLFVSILVALVILPFGSVAPSFQVFPYSLFFSAVAAASVVLLAWDRIADRRGQRLQSLMSRVYFDSGEVNLFLALRSVSHAVTNHLPIAEQHRDSISKALIVLRASGRYHGIDYLYPRKAFTELEWLQKTVRDYTASWQAVSLRIEDFLGADRELNAHVWAMLKGEIILQEGPYGGFFPYLNDGVTYAGAYRKLNDEEGRKLKDFVADLQSREKEDRGVLSPVWRKEIIMRVSDIAHEFTDFLEKHGIPAPFAKDADTLVD